MVAGHLPGAGLAQPQPTSRGTAAPAEKVVRFLPSFLKNIILFLYCHRTDHFKTGWLKQNYHIFYSEISCLGRAQVGWFVSTEWLDLGPLSGDCPRGWLLTGSSAGWRAGDLLRGHVAFLWCLCFLVAQRPGPRGRDLRGQGGLVPGMLMAQS